jgi:protein phosphatase 2C family protein 2/3
MQGWRINMEDSHTHILSLPDDPGTAFFGVYDGHGGQSLYSYSWYFFVDTVLKCTAERVERCLNSGFFPQRKFTALQDYHITGLDTM